MAHWVTQYLGKPWVVGARGPDAFDCFGLLWHVYKTRFGIEIPAHADATDRDVRKTMVLLTKSPELADWQRVTEPFDGAAVGMSQNELFHHVGVLVRLPEGDVVLHAQDGGKAKLTPLARLRSEGWRRIEFFRHKQWPS